MKEFHITNASKIGKIMAKKYKKTKYLHLKYLWNTCREPGKTRQDDMF